MLQFLPVLLCMLSAILTTSCSGTIIPASSTTFEGRTVQKVIWAGNRNQQVWILTDQFLYSSNNFGETFALVDTPDCQRECVRDIFINPINNETVFLMGKSKQNWIRKFNQLKFKTLAFKHKITFFQFHPTLINSFLYTIRSDDVSFSVSIFELYISSDSGTSSVRVTDKISQASWGVNTPNEEFNPALLYATKMYTSTSGGKTIANSIFVGIDLKEPIDGSDDEIALLLGDGGGGAQNPNSGQNTNQDMVNAKEFLFINQKYLFVAVELALSRAKMLMVSINNGHTFRPVTLPFTLAQKAFTILDASENSVFLNVYHEVSRLEPWGTTYSSDYSGSRYSVSLFGNRRVQYSVDFHKIKSLEGIYIANEVTNRDDPECYECGESDTCDLTCHFETKISFDKGGNWEPLIYPIKDNDGNDIVCGDIGAGEKCALHLHGFASMGYQSIYSEPNSVGLIIGTGNVGPYLQWDSINTFMSRDGGFNWEQIRKGSHHYSTTDHGGIIVLVSDLLEVDSLVFSYDEGKSWISYKFSNTSVKVTAIFSSKSSTNMVFLLQTYNLKNFKTGIVMVDFGKFFPRQCQGFDDPDTTTSDYVTFTPKAYDTQCLMGRKMEYIRKRRTVKCYNPRHWERPVSQTNCACDYQDYECDFGYYPTLAETNSETQLHCKPFEGTPPETPIPQPCNGTYTETRGYRCIEGDTCIVPVPAADSSSGRSAVSSSKPIYEPIIKKCPVANTKGSRFRPSLLPLAIIGLMVIVLLFIIVGTFVGVALCVKKDFVLNLFSRRAKIPYSSLIGDDVVEFGEADPDNDKDDEYDPYDDDNNVLDESDEEDFLAA